MLTATAAQSAQQTTLRANGFRPAERRSYGALFATDHFLGRERVDRLFPRWRRGVQERMLECIRQNGEGRVIPLPRFRNLDRDTIIDLPCGDNYFTALG